MTFDVEKSWWIMLWMAFMGYVMYYGVWFGLAFGRFSLEFDHNIESTFEFKES
jgi:hypothetical protein